MPPAGPVLGSSCATIPCRSLQLSSSPMVIKQIDAHEVATLALQPTGKVEPRMSAKIRSQASRPGRRSRRVWPTISLANDRRDEEIQTTWRRNMDTAISSHPAVASSSLRTLVRLRLHSANVSWPLRHATPHILLSIVFSHTLNWFASSKPKTQCHTAPLGECGGHAPASSPSSSPSCCRRIPNAVRTQRRNPDCLAAVPVRSRVVGLAGPAKSVSHLFFPLIGLWDRLLGQPSRSWHCKCLFAYLLAEGMLRQDVRLEETS